MVVRSSRVERAGFIFYRDVEIEVLGEAVFSWVQSAFLLRTEANS